VSTILKKIKNSFYESRVLDPTNVGLYVFALIVVAVTWSGVKTVQRNYELQKKISSIGQENEVLKLQNDNIDLQNKYYETDDYLDLVARQSLGLAGRGEKVILISPNIISKYSNSSVITMSQNEQASRISSESGWRKNLEDWRDFLLGRKLFDD
jgi:cell division protein FtsB